MLMRLIHRYSLKLVFAVTLLLGIQIPSFLEQYEYRVDAHYQEAKRQLNQYQSLADLYFSGDLQVLIRQHKNSEILLFRAEALENYNAAIILNQNAITVGVFLGVLCTLFLELFFFISGIANKKFTLLFSL